MTMGEYIKQLRTSHGFSQEELGKMVGVNRAAVNKWECGRVESIKRSTIEQLAKILGVSPADLMCWNDDSTTFSKQSAIYDDVKEVFGDPACEMLKKFSRLDSVDQGKIIERTDMLLENEKYSVKESCG